MNSDTPRTDEAERLAKDDAGNITRMEPIWDTMVALERELQGFCSELCCTDLTPSGNVVAAMVRLQELKRELHDNQFALDHWIAVAEHYQRKLRTEEVVCHSLVQSNAQFKIEVDELCRENDRLQAVVESYRMQ